MRTQFRVAGLLVCILAMVSACSGNDDPDPRPTNNGTITDGAPYWCQVVPKKGLATATGQGTGGLEETTVPLAGDDTPVPGLCTVGSGLLKLERYTGDTARHRFAEKPPVGSEPHTQKIPDNLGKGASSGSGEQWHVYAMFRCGQTQNLFTLSISKVAKGRDTDADLITLMRIAQHRYAEQAGCTPAGSGADA